MAPGAVWTYPYVKESLLNPAILVKWVGLCVLDKILQTLGFRSTVLLEDIFQRNNDIRIRNRRERRRLSEI
jgi:hypothetical protein